MINIGEQICYFRKLKGYTVNKLAIQSGVSQSYLRDIELGNNTNPGLEILVALCDALEITLPELLSSPSSVPVYNDPLLSKIYRLSSTQRSALL